MHHTKRYSAHDPTQDRNITQAFFTLDYTLEYQLIELTFRGKDSTTYVTPRKTPDLPSFIAQGALWNPCTLPGRESHYTYTVAKKAQEDPYTHVELINGDWYRIEPYEYRGDLFWITQEDWLIASASTLHPVNFTSPTAYYPPTTRAEPEQKRESSESDTSSETGNEPRSTFPNPDTLEPTNASPGAGIAQQLDQAPIFGDVAEPQDEDHKGKSKEAYLPLNPSPMLPTPFVRFTNIGSSSKENLSRMMEPVFGIPSLNPKEDYSPFSSSFTPMK